MVNRIKVDNETLKKIIENYQEECQNLSPQQLEKIKKLKLLHKKIHDEIFNENFVETFSKVRKIYISNRFFRKVFEGDNTLRKMLLVWKLEKIYPELEYDWDCFDFDLPFVMKTGKAPLEAVENRREIIVTFIDLYEKIYGNKFFFVPNRVAVASFLKRFVSDSFLSLFSKNDLKFLVWAFLNYAKDTNRIAPTIINFVKMCSNDYYLTLTIKHLIQKYKVFSDIEKFDYKRGVFKLMCKLTFHYKNYECLQTLMNTSVDLEDLCMKTLASLPELKKEPLQLLSFSTPRNLHAFLLIPKRFVDVLTS